ncbi:MAG: glycosyltransferase [Chitinophagaceae bacterium]
MRTILVTAYAVNPYKGSEEGTGWNLIQQIAGDNYVIAVTRKNNRDDIVKYMNEQAESKELFRQIHFLHFDLPKWMIWWKKGPLLSALYFYMWQFFVAYWIKKQRLSFDIAHSLNFHSNWTPSFLWILKKPFVWGPVGNHPLIPKQYLLSVYGIRAYLKDRLLWVVKWCFWNLDPFVSTCRKKAEMVFCVNSQAAAKLKLSKQKSIFLPAVASESPQVNIIKNHNRFVLLSVGRFVPLKGFDLTIRSFSIFYKSLSKEQQLLTKLVIIGSGPEKRRMHKMIEEEKMCGAIEIIEWMPREKVMTQFQQASAFLFPSHEGAGMVVAEALSYGLPVICLNNYGPGEYVHPSSALKVNHSTYQATIHSLAVKIRSLFVDEGYYAVESSLAIIQFQQQFRWQSKAECFTGVYNKITAKPEPLKKINLYTINN